MGTLWPDPPALPARCEHCHRRVARGRLVNGMGKTCAERHGLIVATPRLRTDPQTGTNLIDLLEGELHDELTEPDDNCDGWDR